MIQDPQRPVPTVTLTSLILSSIPSVASSTAGNSSAIVQSDSLSSASPSSTSLSSTSPTSTSQSGSAKRSIEIGAGIGVPLGVLVVAGLTLCLYREKRGRKKLEKRLDGSQSASGGNLRSMAYRGPPEEQHISFHAHELHHSDRRQHELHSRPMVEIAESM